jgi:hypothetical protein
MLKKFLAAVAVAIAGCAGTVQREAPAAGAPATSAKVAKYKSIAVALTDAAQKKHADNIQFNKDELSGMLKRKLEARSAIVADAQHEVQVTVTDFRVRSAFSAIMFGFMAGTDSIDGTVDVKDPAGKVVNSFKVSASYGLGGLGGGQDSARMNWLYEKFADLAIAEMMEAPKN